MKKITSIILLLFVTCINAQVEFKIKNVKVNGISIPDNSPIEFNGASSHSGFSIFYPIFLFQYKRNGYV